jgi:hypothetical protein
MEQPKIIDAILAYLEAYDNPTDAKGDTRPIQVYQLCCYDVSYEFRFKWIVKKEEIAEIKKWNPKLKIEKNGIMLLSAGNHAIELEPNA